MKKRARRIMDKLRMKAKARRIGARIGSTSYAARCVKNADHLAVCSCYMCGNPRKWQNKPTLAEKMADDWRRIEDDWRVFFECHV